MYAWHPPRALAAGTSVAIVGAIFALLLLGLNMRQTAENAIHLVAIDLTEPPPQPRPTEPPKPPQPHVRKPAAKHEASPRNLRNQATAVVAPPVRLPVPPPPVVTAPKAGVGAAANTGASNRPGPGQGAGGIGNGTGGNGEGEGDDDSVVGPRQIGGKLSYRDLPEGVLAPGQEAAVDVMFRVEPAGNVSTCRIEHSSGYAVLDNLACRLIQQRFRFKPALDENGRPVRAWVEESHSWVAREN